MDNRHDLALILKSKIPIVVVESHEEQRVLTLLIEIAESLGKPLFKWSVTEGLRFARYDIDGEAQHAEPKDVLEHIKAESQPGIYVLLDYHHFLAEPVHTRLLKDIAIKHSSVERCIVLLSHELEIPGELRHYTAEFGLGLPTPEELKSMVVDTANEWAAGKNNQRVKADRQATKLLVKNLSGLTHGDAQRLVRKAIFNDGAISHTDLPGVMKAKYDLLDRDNTLTFEYETSRFAEVGGLNALKEWLTNRRDIFMGKSSNPQLDTPKGILLLGVQGCGKSLAARAVAGAFGAPLLRLDMGAIFNKFYGQSERNVREALKSADTMAPCILWIDEIEKGIAGQEDDGPARRILATLLTWMAEKKSAVFIVATANEISLLPPELVRKGRFDEIFFVDLPDRETRALILKIHLGNRALDADKFDLDMLAKASDGFSGAELEQAVVSALYRAHARDEALNTALVLKEVEDTQPLSVVMAEQVNALRSWASGRTVPAH
ncbi:MAG: AAA family ATPase [Gammaproteobacteria bacterium]|nr:AAA family ATPase [Gammaproteobacteria bacterium]MDH3464680.1 AAA family ATPase [Gammaproteobacteria bacterium]